MSKKSKNVENESDDDDDDGDENGLTASKEDVFHSPEKYLSVEEKALHHYHAMVVLNPNDSKALIKLGDAMCL